MRKLLALFLLASSAFAQQQVQPVAGVLTLNLIPGTSSFKVILSANVTSVVIQNPTPGTIISVIFTENATGGFLVTFGGNIANPCIVATAANTTTTCQFQYDATSNTWNGIGGSGSGGAPGQFSVKTYGALGDARSSRDCVVTLSSASVTSASNPWVAADVGKFIYTSQGYGNPPFNPQKITGFVSAGSITVTNAALGGGTGPCTWFTQKDTTAFAAALATAQAALTSRDPHNGSPTLAYPGTVYCPQGGYVVDGPWFNQNYANNFTNGINFQGAGRGQCQIYISPDFVAGASAVFGFVNQANNFFMDGFSIQGDGMVFSLGNLPGFQLANDANFRLTNFTVADYNNSQDTFGVVYTSAGTGFTMENGLIVSSGQGPGYNCNGTGAVLGLNNVISNGGANNLTVNCGSRGANAQPFVWKGAYIDECSGASSACTVVQSGAVADFDSVGLYGESGTFGALNCLGTCYLNSVDVGSFNSGSNQPAIAEGSTGYVYSTGSWIRGNGTAAMVTGTSAATFIDAGGNKWLNGTASTFNPVTAAQYATLGFTGGIVPTAAIQMPSNTCYPVQGNLLATAQNICAFVLTKNQQITSLSAQSGGTTPANSSCATPPVITLSDGTRSATMTMTTGKTFWTSGVDANTNIPGQVFASGATLTVSIGTNTCATPPSNVSVTYNLQSVLNP